MFLKLFFRVQRKTEGEALKKKKNAFCVWNNEHLALQSSAFVVVVSAYYSDWLSVEPRAKI